MTAGQWRRLVRGLCAMYVLGAVVTVMVVKAAITGEKIR